MFKKTFAIILIFLFVGMEVLSECFASQATIAYGLGVGSKLTFAVALGIMFAEME